MKTRNMQLVSLHIWRKYSITLDRINRNPLCKTFSQQNQNVLALPNRSAFFKYVNENFIKNESIDYLEFGVYQGGSIKEWSRINLDIESKFYGFDTFTGLPENWFSQFPKGAFDAGGVVPSIEDKRITFYKGLFQDTLPNFLKNFSRRSKLVVFIDADLYSSTLYVLTNIHPLLREGDILMFDDFLDPVGEFKAFIDYTSCHRFYPSPIATMKNKKLIERIAFIF